MLQKPTNLTQDLKHIIETIGNKYAPDKRTELFSIEVVESKNGLQLKGDTTNKQAYKELIAKSEKLFPFIENKIRILPEKAIGEKNWGLVYNSIANLHSKPTHKSDIVSQVLLGMPVKLLDISGDWFRIQAPEGYIGWISGSIQRLNYEELKNNLAKPKIIITCQYAKSYIKADTQSQSVSDIVIGNIFTLDAEENDYYSVTNS